MEAIILKFPDRQNLSPEGVMHGPYENIPADMILHYLATRLERSFPADQTQAQFIADRESEWQYDQHAEAIAAAAIASTIDKYAESRLLDNLEPWFIGWRNPGEYDVVPNVAE